VPYACYVKMMNSLASSPQWKWYSMWVCFCFCWTAAEARWREHLHSTLYWLPHRPAEGEGSLDLCGRYRNHKGLGVRSRLATSRFSHTHTHTHTHTGTPTHTQAHTHTHHQLISLCVLLLIREQSRPPAGRPLSLLHLRPVHQQHCSQQEWGAGGSLCRFVALVFFLPLSIMFAESSYSHKFVQLSEAQINPHWLNPELVFILTWGILVTPHRNILSLTSFFSHYIEQGTYFERDDFRLCQSLCKC